MLGTGKDVSVELPFKLMHARPKQLDKEKSKPKKEPKSESQPVNMVPETSSLINLDVSDEQNNNNNSNAQVNSQQTQNSTQPHNSAHLQAANHHSRKNKDPDTISEAPSVNLITFDSTENVNINSQFNHLNLQNSQQNQNSEMQLKQQTQEHNPFLHLTQPANGNAVIPPNTNLVNQNTVNGMNNQVNTGTNSVNAQESGSNNDPFAQFAKMRHDQTN